jgi:hypothetical protein
VLLSEEVSPLLQLSSAEMRLNVMKSLTILSKYLGCYDKWQQMRQRYALKWSRPDAAMQSLQRFFDEGLSFDVMLQRIREMIRLLPTFMARIVKFACLIGLRPSEVVESVRLLNNKLEIFHTYYNPERQCLEHFRFPQQFLRQTKKAYLSFVTPSMLSIVQNLEKVSTYNAIRHACRRSGINMDMRYCRKIFASHLRNEGIQPEIVDMLQGRVSQSILTRHYLVPKPSFKEEVLQALEQLPRQL